MLSIEECKKLINDPQMSDEDIDNIKNSLYESAELAWEIFKDVKYGSKNPIRSLREDN